MIELESELAPIFSRGMAKSIAEHPAEMRIVLEASLLGNLLQ